MIQLKFEKYNKSNWLKEHGYTPEQEEIVYDDQLDDILRNPRWYLDNLDDLKDYRLSWKNYGKDAKFTPTVPRKFVRKQ